MKISEETKDFCCRIIRDACDGDLAQTDWRTRELREAWPVAAMQYIAGQLTAAGYEW